MDMSGPTNQVDLFCYVSPFTVDPLLQAAASNFFDEIFTHYLLSKNCILLKASI